MVFKVLWSHFFCSVVSLFSMATRLSSILSSASVWMGSPSRVHFWLWFFLHQHSCVMQTPMQVSHRLVFPAPMPCTSFPLSFSWRHPCSVFPSYSYLHVSFLFIFDMRNGVKAERPIGRGTVRWENYLSHRNTWEERIRWSFHPAACVISTAPFTHYFIPLSYTSWWWGISSIYFLMLLSPPQGKNKQNHKRGIKHPCVWLIDYQVLW